MLVQKPSSGPLQLTGTSKPSSPFDQINVSDTPSVVALAVRLDMRALLASWRSDHRVRNILIDNQALIVPQVAVRHRRPLFEPFAALTSYELYRIRAFEKLDWFCASEELAVVCLGLELCKKVRRDCKFRKARLALEIAWEQLAFNGTRNIRRYVIAVQSVEEARQYQKRKMYALVLQSGIIRTLK